MSPTRGSSSVHASSGAEVSGLQTRLAERLDREEPILLRDFPTVRLDRSTNTVTLPAYQLPAGWSHEVTDVLFGFPANYPAGCPDNVCVRADLRLASGEMPGNHMGIHSYAGREWLQLSWHIEPGDWTPTDDPSKGSNLGNYLVGALTRLDDPS